MAEEIWLTLFCDRPPSSYADVMDGHFVPNLVLGKFFQSMAMRLGSVWLTSMHTSTGAPPLSSVHKAVPGIFMDVSCLHRYSLYHLSSS